MKKLLLKLSVYFSALTRRERELLIARHLLAGKKIAYDELAKKEGITKQRLYQIENQAIYKMEKFKKTLLKKDD